MRRSKSPRRLDATSSAEIEVNDVLIDSRLDALECQADKEESEKEAKQCIADAQDAEKRQVHKDSDNSMNTARGVFGFVLFFAVAGLSYALFMSMGIPWPLSLLLAGVEFALFAGVGSLALEKIRQGGEQLLVGVGLLVALGVLAFLLVPPLAEARADEMYAERIAEAQAQVDVNEELAGKRQSRRERLLLKNAQNKLEALPAQRERAKNIFMIVLAATLAGEMLLSGYSADMLSRARARRLKKKAKLLEADARDAEREAANQDLTVYKDLSDVARNHALPIATIDQLTQIRDAVQTSGSVFALPAQGGEAKTAAAIEAVSTVAPAPGLAIPQAPIGSITAVEAPAPPQISAPDAEWDGVWA